MRVYLSGQKSFGAAALELLRARGVEIAGVASPAWRDQDLPHPFGPVAGVNRDPLAMLAEHHGLPWIEAHQLRAETLPDDVDLIVAAHSHAFIGRPTRLRARLGAIGYHPSLLPLHRGRDAIRWAIHMGDRVTGGTVYWLTDNVDAGPIAAQDYALIRPDDDAGELWRRELFPLGLRLLDKVLRDLAVGTIVKVPQDEALATWEPSWHRPPLHRPELLQIGPAPDGYTVSVDRRDARAP